jgi:hypothetical protein
MVRRGCQWIHVVHRWCGVVHGRSSWSVVGSIVVGVVSSSVVVLTVCRSGDAGRTTNRILLWFDSELVSMKIALLNRVRKSAGKCIGRRILTSASAARSASWQEAYSMNAKTLVAPSAVGMVNIERIKTGNSVELSLLKFFRITFTCMMRPNSRNIVSSS